MDNSRIELEKRIAELEAQIRDANAVIGELNFAVRAEKERVRIASDTADIGLWEYGIKEGILYQVKKLGGIYEAELSPIRNFRETMLNWGSVYLEDIPEFHKFCDALERGDAELSYEIRNINDYSDIVWYRYEGRTVFDENGEPVRVIGRTTDVTDEKGTTRVEIMTADSEDSYSVFMSMVNDKHKEKSGRNSALVLYGIDHFEKLAENEEFSTEPVETTLEKLLDAQCAVEQGSIYAKVKDGIYAVYTRFSEIPKLNTIIARSVYKFHDMQFSDGVSSDIISVSAGVSIFKNNKSYEDAFREAEIALKTAVLKGGNGFLHFNSAMETASSESETDEELIKSISGLLGSDSIYKCVNIALTDEKSRYTAIKKAMALTGSRTSCSSVVFRWLGDESDTVVWSDFTGDAIPRIIPGYSAEKLAEMFTAEDKCITIVADKSADAKYGFDFADGACCAVCCPVKGREGVKGYFAFVSDTRISWQHTDISILETIKSAVDCLIADKEKRAEIKRHTDFAAAVTNDLNIEGFTVVPDTFEVDYVGDSMARSCGMKSGDICYKRIRGIDAPCGDCPIHQLAGGQLSASTAHYRESDNRWIEVTASRFHGEDGSLRYAVSRADVTSCISNIRTRDALTGVLSFDSFSVDAMRLLAENTGGVTVAMVSVANFRQLNETSGYETGNAVIIAAADVLNSSVNDGELLCRVDGARFAVLFRDGDTERVCLRLKRISAAIQAQIQDKCGLKIYVVSGVYTLDGDNIGIMAALDRAILAQKTVKDKAYYTSNLTAVYDSRMDDEMLSKQYIERHMVEALENDEFKVYYQPKVDPLTGRVMGAEALVRWIRPDGEIISPGRFIPLFERNGFISDMDFAVYRSVITDIRRWQGMGIDIPVISMNVSRDHLNDDRFVENICGIAFKSGVSSSRIELEITESMLNDNMSRLIDIMTALKDAGFRISVDDFGSGYSSLNLIALLPFDTLKIDGGFFLKNQLTDKNMAVISSVIELAKKLRLTVVSEGVETDEQVDFLKKLECELIQGYYYYKPMPSAEFEKILAEQYG